MLELPWVLVISVLIQASASVINFFWLLKQNHIVKMQNLISNNFELAIEKFFIELVDICEGLH